jgi:formylglycine-generating enzyme required for sulfatase activity
MGSNPLKPPDAFLSYTRFDDQRARGKISQLRNELADAVRAVTGEPFEIFQDTDGIGLGEHWPGKLDQMLDEARFFIPILTPSYFKSPACRDELDKFFRLEKEKKRRDLILPIYYLDCDVLEEREERLADRLATAIHERQRYDLRQLRHHGFSTRKMAIEIERLARAIRDAKRRGAAPVPHPRPQPGAVSGALGGTFGSDSVARTVLTPIGFELSPGTVFRDIDAPWCPELVMIPPGEFMMGSTAAEREWAVEQGGQWALVEREKPQHLVRIAYSLAVGRYPITFEEYGYFARTTARAQPDDKGWGRGRRPVINVNWEDAKSFVAWLSFQTGQSYRLLSEGEWEYACRAGTTTRFWWGDEITPKNASYVSQAGETSKVGSYPANPFGLSDTHGNVWEWVEDCWNENYKGAPDDGSAWTSGDCGRRVLRGALGAGIRWTCARPTASAPIPSTAATAGASGSPGRSHAARALPLEPLPLYPWGGAKPQSPFASW